MRNFVKGVHYFGEGSPINMWPTISVEHATTEIERYRREGFNTVILLIPWAGFHRSLDDKELDPKYMERLRIVLDLCQKNNLDVIVRLGYLWDSAPAEQGTYARYQNLVIDKRVFSSWLRFARLMYEYLSPLSNFAFAFISWEDFYWPIYRHYSETSNKQQIQAFIEKTGYARYPLRPSQHLRRDRPSSWSYGDLAKRPRGLKL